MTPFGNPYENTKQCWTFLTDAGKYARWLGLVDPASFVDRRNAEPIIFFESRGHIEPFVDADMGVYADMDIPDMPDPPEYEIYDFHGEQRYHIEIWCEKSTMNDVLLPLCELHKVNLITSLGEISITACNLLVDRVSRIGKPCRIFYISDFDPAGRSMPVATSRKIEKFLDDLDQAYDVKLVPLVLSHEQCIQYELPRTPIKDGESRGEQFEKRFGEGATELDALEALHPGELKKIVSDAIMQYRDYGLNARVRDVSNEMREYLDDIRDNILSDFSTEIDELNTEYDSICTDFSTQFNDLNDKTKNVYHVIQNEMTNRIPDLSNFEIPEAEEAEENGGFLFDSSRDYFQQLKAYKDFQGRHTRANKQPVKKLSSAEI